MLEEFVRQFGATVYGAIARARLDELKKNQIALVTPPAPAPPHDLCGSATSTVSLSSRSATPLLTAEECALKPKDVFRECEKCPEMVVGAGRQLHHGLAAERSVSSRVGRAATRREDRAIR